MREKSAGFLRSDRASNNPRSSRQKKTADEEEGKGEEGRENRVRSRNRTGGCFTAIFLEERYKRELFAVYVERSSSSSSSSFGFPFGREPWKSVVLQKPWKSVLFHGEGWRRKTESRHPARVSVSLYLEENFSARRGGFFAARRGFRHDFRFFFMGSRLWI